MKNHCLVILYLFKPPGGGGRPHPLTHQPPHPGPSLKKKRLGRIQFLVLCYVYPRRYVRWPMCLDTQRKEHRKMLNQQATLWPSNSLSVVAESRPCGDSNVGVFSVRMCGKSATFLSAFESHHFKKKVWASVVLLRQGMIIGRKTEVGYCTPHQSPSFAACL